MKPLPRILLYPARITTRWLEGTPQKQSIHPIYYMLEPQPHRLVSGSDISKGVRLVRVFSSCIPEFVFVYTIASRAPVAF